MKLPIAPDAEPTPGIAYRIYRKIRRSAFALSAESIRYLRAELSPQNLQRCVPLQWRRRLDFRKHVPILLVFLVNVPCAAQEFSLSNREFSVAVRNQDGAYEIRTKQNAPVLYATVAALVDHGWTKSNQYPEHQVASSTFHNSLGDGRQLMVTFSGLPGRPTLSYVVRLYDDLPFGDIVVEVHNNTSKTINVQSIRSLEALGSPLLNLGAKENSERVLSEAFSEDGVDVSDLGAEGAHQAFGSQLVYNRDSRESLFFGAATSNRFLTALRLGVGEVQGAHRVTSYTIDSVGTTGARSQGTWWRRLPKEERVELSVPVAPGATLPAEQLMFSLGSDYHQQLEDYGTVIRQLHRARVTGPTLMGWWSWTSYYLNINERAVLSNARWMAQHLESSGYNVVFIDEGYAYSRGDYTKINAAKFPRGMRSVADELSRLGIHLVGLWVTPLMVEEKAWIARHRRNWLVKDERGQPLWFYGSREGRRVYVLDATQPEAAAYMRATYQTLVKRWGIRLIKLDFMGITAVEGNYHRPHTTAMEAQRIALKTIRDAVGEDVLLDKDDSPWINPVGIVDEGRIAGDSKHSFSDLKENAVALATRYYMHRNFFISDPDAFTLQREVPAGQIKADNKPATPLSLSEAQMSIALAALSGGMLEIGDDLPTLSAEPERLALLTNPDLLQMAKTGRAATTLDVLDYSPEDLQPSVSLLREDDRQFVLAVFNWTDGPRSHTFALSSLGLVEGHPYSFGDVFNHDSTGATRAGNSIVISDQPPHSVKVIKIVDGAHPNS